MPIIVAVRKIIGQYNRQIPLFDLEGWRRIIARFSLAINILLGNWDVVSQYLGRGLLPNPGCMAEMSKIQISGISAWNPNLDYILLLWKACSIALNPAGSTSYSRINFNVCGGLMAQSVRMRDVDDTLYAKNTDRALANLDAPVNFRDRAI